MDILQPSWRDWNRYAAKTRDQLNELHSATSQRAYNAGSYLAAMAYYGIMQGARLASRYLRMPDNHDMLLILLRLGVIDRITDDPEIICDGVEVDLDAWQGDVPEASGDFENPAMPEELAEIFAGMTCPQE
jgi:hypothetical protein